MFSILNKIKSGLTTLSAAFFDLLFPVSCLGCGRDDALICPSCAKQIRINASYGCPHCKRLNNTGAYCEFCQPIYALDGVLVATDYKNILLQKIIKGHKYKFVKDLSLYLEDILQRFLEQWEEFIKNYQSDHPWLAKKNMLIIPVPLHPRRLRWRGFNQSALLADFVAHQLDLPLNAQDLVRKKYNRPQAKLDQGQRRKNITDSFIWNGPDLSGQTVILVDDIITTGSTLDECAKVLKRRGAKRVWGLVVAQG